MFTVLVGPEHRHVKAWVISISLSRRHKSELDAARLTKTMQHKENMQRGKCVSCPATNKCIISIFISRTNKTSDHLAVGSSHLQRLTTRWLSNTWIFGSRYYCSGCLSKLKNQRATDASDMQAKKVHRPNRSWSFCWFTNKTIKESCLLLVKETKNTGPPRCMLVLYLPTQFYVWDVLSDIRLLHQQKKQTNKLYTKRKIKIN